jgi:hypothetical protein
LRTSIIGFIAVAAIAVGVAGAAWAQTASAPAHMAATHSCASVAGAGHTWAVTVDRGFVSCRAARKVLRAFIHGKGSFHGPKNGPAHKQYWALYGWRCGRGNGAVDCIRHGHSFGTARDYIYAESQ